MPQSRSRRSLPPLFAGARRVLFFHAHPDDESLWTGGLIARLTDAGVTVRVVTCTRGERGEVVPGPLKWLEGTDELAEYRTGELTRALRELGAGKPCFLGGVNARAYYRGPGFRYLDSGMTWGVDGRATAAPHDADADALNAPDALHASARAFSGNRAALDDARAAAKRFAPDLIVSYDAGGGYGHPDHEWAHVVAKAAAESRRVPFVETAPAEASVGIEIAVDLAAKRRALAAHATQLTLTTDGYILSGGQHHALTPTERYRHP